jgi:hypothetical protein
MIRRRLATLVDLQGMVRGPRLLVVKFDSLVPLEATFPRSHYVQPSLTGTDTRVPTNETAW